MALRIYLASRFSDRKRLRPIAAKLWELGFEPVSSWLNECSRIPEMEHEEFWRSLALKDVAEINRADLVIRDLHRTSSTGGADTEFGYSLGQYQNKMLWIIGKPRNVFHTLAHRQFDSWAECLKELKKYAPKRKRGTKHE